MFARTLRDVFSIGDKGLVLQLTNVTGEPRAKDRFICRFADGTERRGEVQDVSRDAGTGKVVADRSCLTGKPVPPYTSFLVDWPLETKPSSDCLPANIKSEEI